jgi:hypothetical protein
VRIVRSDAPADRRDFTGDLLNNMSDSTTHPWWRAILRRKGSSSPKIAFRLFLGQKTHPPCVVNYLHFAYGYLPQTEETATHYYRCRPWMGDGTDPAGLSSQLRTRNRVTQSIIDAEKTPEQQALWIKLLAMPPSHVVRFGWKSLATGRSYDILYIGLNFNYAKLDPQKLALEFSDYFLRVLPVLSSYDLCPPTKDLLAVQEFLLVLVFRHYYWFLIEEPRGLYR